MMVEFADLSMQILAIIGLPLICVLCPLHYFCGGSFDLEDPLSGLVSSSLAVVQVGLGWPTSSRVAGYVGSTAASSGSWSS